MKVFLEINVFTLLALWITGLTPLCVLPAQPPWWDRRPSWSHRHSNHVAVSGKRRDAADGQESCGDDRCHGGWRCEDRWVWTLFLFCFSSSGVFNKQITCRCFLILSQACWKLPSQWSLLMAAAPRRRRTSCVPTATPANPGQPIQPSWRWRSWSGASWSRSYSLILKSFS